MGLSRRGWIGATPPDRADHSDRMREQSSVVRGGVVLGSVPRGNVLRGSVLRGSVVRGSVAQRVRLGLTGLAAIFLGVLIAAAGMRPDKSWQPSGAPGEPLAVLGVAPGAGPAEAAPEQTAAARARRSPG